MNVFTLCTGRCGSTTFFRASQHIHNFTAGHETRVGLLGVDRLAYPPNHIEADNRLSWLLGRLEKAWGDGATYVHLTRDTDAVADSFVKRMDRGIMLAYRQNGILMNLPADTDPRRIALDYCETVNANIEAFLRDKTRKMSFRLEDAARDFPAFCDLIGADVDLAAAMAEFEIRHNASPVAATK